MRVECRSSEREGREFGITIGRTYRVVELNLQPSAEEVSQRLLFRLEADDHGIPGLYEADLFVPLDERIPSGCVLKKSSLAGSYVVGPAAWSAPNFWEDYFDGNVAAREAFASELARIRDELP